jgi:hypothetical protein
MRRSVRARLMSQPREPIDRPYETDHCGGDRQRQNHGPDRRETEGRVTHRNISVNRKRVFGFFGAIPCVIASAVLKPHDQKTARWQTEAIFQPQFRQPTP